MAFKNRHLIRNYVESIALHHANWIAIEQRSITDYHGRMGSILVESFYYFGIYDWGAGVV